MSILRIARLGRVDYAAALELQQALVAQRSHDTSADTLLVLEHPPTYTLGRGADERFLLDPPAGVPIHRVSRGGQVTWHGPGQLVGYPILKLEGAERDVMRYLRRLEQVIIAALARCGIAAERRAGLTGVWVGTEKIASIGVGIRRWVTLHGFAVNVAIDPDGFARIVPCGIAGCHMTSIAKLGVEGVSMAAFSGLIAEAFAAVFGYQQVEALNGRALVATPAAPDDLAAHG
ncbi:MAG TPA: lipoyl(octanoyl) transferase LipB [Candidatus Binataceae bacterium]|nr:lipoyl(octanoyl) transferase LipB [Candidatus Binataceae bacterium]